MLSRTRLTLSASPLPVVCRKKRPELSLFSGPSAVLSHTQQGRQCSHAAGWPCGMQEEAAKAGGALSSAGWTSQLAVLSHTRSLLSWMDLPAGCALTHKRSPQLDGPLTRPPSWLCSHTHALSSAGWTSQLAVLSHTPSASWTSPSRAAGALTHPAGPVSFTSPCGMQEEAARAEPALRPLAVLSHTQQGRQCSHTPGWPRACALSWTDLSHSLTSPYSMQEEVARVQPNVASQS